ncbi:MAG: leucine-rich repeat protein, partial [Candidatus Spyradenecus sp.]
LPASVTELGDRVFTRCNRVLVAEGNRNYKSVDGVLFSANNEWLLHFPVYRGGEYATPVNVHFVGEEAFMGNTALTQVYLADITTLEPRAFKDCSGLLACFATEGLLTIQANAFENATELRAFSVPATVSLLEDGAFKNCPKLNLIAFRGTVPTRTGRVFTGMNLDQTRSTYPEEHAAAWEAALDGSLMWDGLKMVADYYYDGTDGNYQYRVYGGEATITGTTVPLAGEVRLPMTLDGYLVTGIGARAFVTSTGLTAITFPKSLLSIGDYAFAFCKKLQSVTFEGRPLTKGTAPTQPFPANTTAIGNYPAELESAWSKVIQAGYYYGLRMGLVEVQIILDGEGEVRGAGTYHIDELVTLEAVPAKGQRFVEWTFLDGTTSTANPLTFTATEACYVMATFEADPTAVVISNITYENLMGATHCNPATYEEGTEYTFTTPSEVTGYTFQGWLPAAIDRSMTGDQTIRATWRANGYTVVYAPNGAMGSMDHTAAVYDEPFTLSANAFTYSGRRFLGWALKADGPVAYADSAEVRNLTAESEGVVTLYAIWEVMPFLPGDNTAAIEGSAETGWVVKPSERVGEIVVSIPEGVEAAKVTVEVPSTATSVTANGAAIKVVKVDGETRYDITDFLNMPAAVAGKVDLSQAEVKAEIAEAILDTSAEGGAVFDPSAKQPLTTAETKPGLTYILLEGDSLDSLEPGESKVGDGQPWTPNLTKRGSSAFYRIRISK